MYKCALVILFLSISSSMPANISHEVQPFSLFDWKEGEALIFLAN